MSNMSYVMFENTLSDLRDCIEKLDAIGGDLSQLSESEQEAAQKLIELYSSMAGQTAPNEIVCSTGLCHYKAQPKMRRAGLVVPMLGTMRSVVWDEGTIPVAGVVLWVEE